MGGGQSQRETSPSEHLASAARAIVRAEGLAAELAADISARAPTAESSGSQVDPRQRNRIRRGGKATVAVLQALLSENPTAAFARADIDGSGDLTFDEWHLAFGGEGGVEADVLRALFDEFDADQNGCVSLAEFQAGLKMVDLCGLVAFARCAELRGALLDRCTAGWLHLRGARWLQLQAQAVPCF